MKQIIAMSLACWMQVGLIYAQETSKSVSDGRAEAPAADLVEMEATADSRTADDLAIRKTIDSYVEAFNQGDAKALAGHWRPEGELTMPGGETVSGQAQLEQAFQTYFKESPNAKLELVDTLVEFISPSVAVESGIARVLVPEKQPSESEYEAVHVKSGGLWKIDSTREQNLPAPPPSHYEQLRSLEWMIGTWVDEDGVGAVETTCRWTTNRNFIVRSFKVYLEERIDFEGTQVIGWDPHAKAIRSWMFDSDGGFGSGRWSGTGNQWSVQMLNVLPDGRRASATNIYDVIDVDTVQFRAIGRQVDGKLLPNIQNMRLVRTAQR